MTPERHNRIGELFKRAVGLKAEEREAFLEQECGDDAELKQAVATLLKNDDPGTLLSERAGPGAEKPIRQDLSRELIGQTISHYQVTAKLGEGGMGVVYRAKDTHLDRFAAIKILPPEKVANPERKRRFVQEAKAASALNHPNIVHIYDIDQENGIDFMVMEYVAGKTLAELIPRHGMRLNEALKCSAQIAAAVTAAHEVGIVHRDLKPGNIIVGDDGRVRVLDFGLAKLTEAVPESDESQAVVSGDAHGTEEGTILGTASYMSPEQAEGQKVDARSDIFSFGSVLYEMVTGQPPFLGDSAMSTLAAIITKKPRPLSAEIPHDLRKVINRCLRKDPERRFQYMKDLWVELEELKEESDSGTLDSGPASLLQAHAGRGTRARVISVTAAAVVLLAAGWLWFNRSSTAPAEADMTVGPLTTHAGWENSPSFSPDGNDVVFSWNGEKQDNFDIYRKQIGSPTLLRLTSDPAWDGSPAWSPDGRSIAFWRRLKDRYAVILIPAIGGPERVLTEIDTRAWREFFLKAGVGLAWLPDGKWIVLNGRRLVSTDTGEELQINEPREDVAWETSPAVSPNGRQIAFSRAFSEVHWEIFVQDLSRERMPVGEARQLTALNLCSTTPAWNRDGSEIVFSSGTFMEGKRLWRVSASGANPPTPLLVAGGGASWPAISRAGNRLAYTRTVSETDIVRLPLPAAEGAANELHPLISSTRNDRIAQYSPDGKRIAFLSDRTGEIAIWLADADGSNTVELFSQQGKQLGSPRWSPDGQRLAFDLQQEIFVIAAGGGKLMRITENPALDARPSWSRDGRWIYFHSDRTGRLEIWKASSAGGDAIQVTTDRGSDAFESPDGEFVYFLKFQVMPDISEVWKVPTAGGAPTLVTDGLFETCYALADRGVYYLARPEDAGGHPVRVGRLDGVGEGLVLKFLENSTGKEHIVTRLEGRLPAYPFSVSTDGRFILFTAEKQSGSDLMLVENFR